MGFTKTLNFRYKDLGQDGFLIFTFDDDKIAGHEMYKDFYPVVWKVAHLQGKGQYQFSETYYQQFAFATAELEQGKVKTSSAVVDIDFKQKTTLTGDEKKGYEWSAPETVSGMQKDHFTAINGTAKGLNLAICSDPGNSALGFVQPIMYSDVGAGGNLEVEFTGRLRIYSVTSMQEGEVLRTQVTSPKLFDHPIHDPSLPDNWVITFNTTTKNFEIKSE